MAVVVAVVRAIRSRKPKSYELSAFNKSLEDALKATEKAMIKDFESTVSTWRHKPRFKRLSSSGGLALRGGGRDVVLRVGVNDKSKHSDIYAYVNYGTRPHIISAVNANFLRWPTGQYVAKTVPNQLVSKKGSIRGGLGGRGRTKQYNYARSVNHPGTQGRFFDQVIANKHIRLNTLGKNIQERWNNQLGE